MILHIFLKSVSKNIILDFIGKTEFLDTDFKKICNIIGIEDLSITHLNKSIRSHSKYSDYYDMETKNIIANFYAKDVELFKYSFDS